MFHWNTKDHEKPYGTGLSACAGTAEGGCPTFSEHRKYQKQKTENRKPFYTPAFYGLLREMTLCPYQGGNLCCARKNAG
jgi:hypothetical protein